MSAKSGGDPFVVALEELVGRLAVPKAGEDGRDGGLLEADAFPAGARGQLAVAPRPERDGHLVVEGKVVLSVHLSTLPKDRCLVLHPVLNTLVLLSRDAAPERDLLGGG